MRGSGSAAACNIALQHVACARCNIGAAACSICAAACSMCKMQHSAVACARCNIGAAACSMCETVAAHWRLLSAAMGLPESAPHHIHSRCRSSSTDASVLSPTEQGSWRGTAVQPMPGSAGRPCAEHQGIRRVSIVASCKRCTVVAQWLTTESDVGPRNALLQAGKVAAPYCLRATGTAACRRYCCVPPVLLRATGAADCGQKAHRVGGSPAAAKTNIQ
jgi:hypothetical protein